MLKIQENILLADYTSFGIGGPARYFAEVESVADLKEAVKLAKEKGLEFFVLGGGSNVLVSDAGYPGLAIRVKLENISLQENGAILIGAGVSLAQVVSFTVENSLAGLEWAAGIPGTIGGAVVGNAGTPEGEMKNSVRKVEFFDIEKFGIFSLSGDKCDFYYRSSYFKGKKNVVILNVELALEKGEVEEIKAKIEKKLLERRNKQPLGGRSAGSFFENPIVLDANLREEFEKEKGVKCKENKVPAGWFIEKIDFKGKQIGGAQVSVAHANFILNVDNAKAEDFVILASMIKQKVRDKYGVQLKEEVQYVGF